MLGPLNLVKDLTGKRSSLPLVGDKGLVDFEGLFVCDKRAAPFLAGLWHRVGRLDPDKEPSLEVEDGVNVEKDVVHDVTGNYALDLERLFEVVQVFEILNVFAFCIHQLPHDVVPVAHLRSSRLHGVVLGVGLRLDEQTALVGEIQYVIDHRNDLDIVRAK
jgi:hypothetical protein